MRFTKYDKKGAYHWHLYGKSGYYRRHVARIKNWVKERNVLDVGAGDGLIAHHLGIIGIDKEPTAIKLAQERGVNVMLGDAYHTDFADEAFDAVLMVDVLEHFFDPGRALREARRILKKHLYIVTPPKDLKPGEMDPFHYREWTPAGLKEVVEKEGFKLVGDVLVVENENSMYAKFKK